MGPLVINISVNYCGTNVLLHAKMLKETEESNDVFVTFLSLVAFQFGGGERASWELPGYVYERFATQIF